MLRPAAVGLVVLLAGCGGATNRPKAASTTTTPGAVSLTAADNNRTIDATVGQTIDVTLSSGELWAKPTVSDPTLLVPTGGGVDQSTGSASATFRAAKVGTSDVRSDRRCLPKPGQACAQYLALWKVTVVVH